MLAATRRHFRSTTLTAPDYISQSHLTVNHRQPGFVEKSEAPMFEQPDGEDGEGEEHDEDQQVYAVLSVALLSLLFCNDVLHGTVLLRR